MRSRRAKPVIAPPQTQAAQPVYEFSLTFQLPEGDADPGPLLDALFEAGLDDATVGIGKPGMIALELGRTARSADAAIDSALHAAEGAMPGAHLVEVGPDLVNLTDLADLLGLSRQNMRKYASGEIRSVAAAFPAPAVSGGPAPLWHLAEIGIWFDRHTQLRLSRSVIDAALAAHRVNVDTERARLRRLRKSAARLRA